MGENVKVSIVVHVYNVPESALRKCLESTINQTMKEVEVLVIDDGSTDHSGLICDEYAASDNRIRVIHKANGGLSAARNTGYEMARGEWITFLDSDDWIDPATCEKTYNLGIENDVDIVIFGTVQEFEHYTNPFKYHFENGRVFRGEECKQLQCEILNFTGNIATAWAKLIRKSVLDKNQIEHNAGLRQGSEGIEFNVRLFEKIESAVFTDEIFYHYIFNPNSISAKHDEKNHYFVIRCFEEIKNEISVSNNREALENRFYKRFAYVIVATAISGFFSPANRVSFYEQKKGYLKYLQEPLVQNTLQEVNLSELDKQRALIIWMIRMHLFLPIKLLAKIRYKQKHGD